MDCQDGKKDLHRFCLGRSIMLASGSSILGIRVEPEEGQGAQERMPS